jgi:hypothetical protein
MSKIIITERQYKKITTKLLSERLGVPDFILDSANTLYELVADYLKNISEKRNEYTIEQDVQLPIGDMMVDEVEININVEELDEQDETEIASMGVANRFGFDDDILMKIQLINNNLELTINFVANGDWEYTDLYNVFTKDKTHSESVLAHELKHKYDKTKKRTDLIGRDAEYQSYIKGMRFGIPVIDRFILYSYYIQHVENLVRPTEIASRMRQGGITKDKFREFIENDIVYQELLKIKNFSYEYLIQSMKEQIDRVKNLLDYVDVDYEDMSEDEMITEVLELVYVNLVNTKLEIFDRMITNRRDDFLMQLGQMFGMPPELENKMKVKKKFFNYVIKYRDREIEFFVDECEKFNYIATKMIKKIGKLYDMAADKEQTNESIINWDLHQKMMEKKYGKRKIDRYYKF